MEGVSTEDAVKFVSSVNCLSWILGHLASQEQYLWLVAAQEVCLFPGLDAQVGYGSPKTSPPWNEMQTCWNQITNGADHF